MISKIYKQITSLGFLFIILCLLSLDASDSLDLSYKAFTEYIIPDLGSNPIRILFITIPTVSLGILLLYRYTKNKKYIKLLLTAITSIYISYMSILFYTEDICVEKYYECPTVNWIINLIHSPETPKVKTPLMEKLESQISPTEKDTRIIEVTAD